MGVKVKSKHWLLGLSLLGLLLGCSSGGEVPIRYYVLDPTEQNALSANSAKVSVHIVDLHMPQYLERYQMAMRSGENELTFSDSHQWGENLRKNLLRTLSSNLSNLLGTPEISTPIARSDLKSNKRIRLFIERFDQSKQGVLILHARYQISGTGRDPKTYNFRKELKNASPRNYSSMVKNMGVLFGDLSVEIAKKLMAVEVLAQQSHVDQLHTQGDD